MQDPDLTPSTTRPWATRTWTAAALALALLGACPTLTSADPAPIHSKATAQWSIERHDHAVTAIPPAKMAPVDLVLDDGSREADIGFTGLAAFQFLWFNRFDPPAPAPDQAFGLEQIQVLFPSDPNVTPGAAIQLVVFTDSDGDPTTGANFVAAFDDVVQFADGVTFSVYPVDPPLNLTGSDDLLIGVVNRFAVSGVSPASRPAALDTTTSAGRSWVALWTGDPPDPPSLPSDGTFDLIDVIEPGNWMIRAAGTRATVAAIPSLGASGLAALTVLLALVGAALLRRP